MLRVAESGLRTPDDLARAAESGADAALIGSTLMRSADPRSAVACFARAGRGELTCDPLHGVLPLAGGVKVCGLTLPADVIAARKAGADLFGFICEPTASPRAVSLEQGRRLVAEMPACLLYTSPSPRD